MPRIRFTAAYDGRPYLGWQSQPGGRTVQDVLERAFSDLLEPPAVSTVPAGQTPAFMLWARFFMQTLRIPTAFLRTNGLPRSTRACPEPSGLPMRNTFRPVSMPGSVPREKPTVTAFHALPSSTLLTPGWPGTARWHGAWIFWNRLYTCSGERMTSLLLPPCAAMNRAPFRRLLPPNHHADTSGTGRGTCLHHLYRNGLPLQNGAPHDGSRP